MTTSNQQPLLNEKQSQNLSKLLCNGSMARLVSKMAKQNSQAAEDFKKKAAELGIKRESLELQ